MRRLILLLSTVLGLMGCAEDCTNVYICAAISPDGLLKATAFSRDCGATTEKSIQVFLGGVDEAVPDVGNIFRGINSDKASLRWEGDGKLMITTPAETFMLVSRFGGVAIEKVRQDEQEKR